MFRLFAVLSLFTALAAAQSTGTATLVGAITDTSDAIIPGVKVAARNLGTQFVYESQTNSTGAYYIPNLPSGNYELTVESKGFKRYVQADLILRINEQPRVDVRLEVGKSPTPSASIPPSLFSKPKPPAPVRSSIPKLSKSCPSCRKSSTASSSTCPA